MIVTSCSPQSWAELRGGADKCEVAYEIRLALCRQYGLTLAVKEGVRPSRVRKEENEIRYRLHENFACLKGWQVHTVPTTVKCDICRVIEAIKRLARSDYTQQCSAFMLRTQGDTESRKNYSLAATIEEYIASAKLGVEDWVVKDLYQAKKIIQAVQVASNKVQKANITVQTVYNNLFVDELLERSEKRLASRVGSHLRIVQ